MAVVRGLWMAAHSARVQQTLNRDPEGLPGIARRARDAGGIHHSWFAREGGGEVLVVEEWPTRAATSRSARWTGSRPRG
jgi:hypothetical protein